MDVVLTMREVRLKEALGNVIHGDGTTKYHKKYQNFQVILPAITSRTTGPTQMGKSDIDVVVDAFESRMAAITAPVETIADEDDQDKIFKDLIISYKPTMTYQGQTMSQFSDAIASFRKELLPSVVNNWESVPTNVKTTVKVFGTFYCNASLNKLRKGSQQDTQIL